MKKFKIAKVVNLIGMISIVAGAVAPLVQIINADAAAYVMLAGGIAAAITKPAFEVSTLLQKFKL